MATNLKNFSQEIEEFMEWTKREQELFQTTLNSMNDNLHEISTKLPFQEKKQWLPLITENTSEDTRFSIESQALDIDHEAGSYLNRTSTLIVFTNHHEDSHAIESQSFRNSSSETKFTGSQEVLSPSKSVANRISGKPKSILRKQYLFKENNDEGRKKIRLLNNNSSVQSPSKNITK